MLKGLISILLICSLVGPYLGISLYLKHEKKMIKREIKHKIIEGIDRSELVKLSFSPNEENQLRWEHSKEFEFKGEMYDVVEKETIDGKTVYWCWWDNEETKLNKQLNQLLAKKLGQQCPDNNQQVISNFLKSLFFPTNEILVRNEIIAEKKSVVAFQYRVSFDSFISEIIPPPPKLVESAPTC